MYINFLVVRQASAPEGVSPAQRWILTDSDEFKRKLDASDKSAKASNFPITHNDPDSAKEDIDEG